jgi:4-hydroxy-3-polyprenylbenzoate decarboxylase
MVFGGDPLMFMASCTEVPYGVSEYAWVGGVRGEPVEVIRGPVTGLPIPADAEIVVEGFATNQQQLTEGPFGEWTGYYASASREEPILNVSALYFRDAPILVGAPPGQPPDELARYRAILLSALLRDELGRLGLPNVHGAWQHEVGGARLLTVVSIRPSYPGHAAQTLHLTAQCPAAAYSGRWVIVVDDDIDPSNLEEVMWALCTRADPATDIDIIHRAWSTPLDPFIPPDRKRAGDYTNSRGLIDATRPWAWRNEFPPLNLPSQDQRAAGRARWQHLLDS